jgi:hypothetical protein
VKKTFTAKPTESEITQEDKKKYTNISLLKGGFQITATSQLKNFKVSTFIFDADIGGVTLLGPCSLPLLLTGGVYRHFL